MSHHQKKPSARKTLVRKTIMTKGFQPAANTATDVQVKPAIVALRLFQVTGAQPADPRCEPFALPATGPLPLIEGMKQLERRPDLAGCALWALLPDDFGRRTGLAPEALARAIESRPGFDVYFCHANPELEAIYHNPWLQAEATNPGFAALARDFLQAAGLSDAPINTLTRSSLFATGHLIGASPAFWADYLTFIDRVMTDAQARLSPATRAALFDEIPQPRKYTRLYLIIARLLGLFLVGQGSRWRACKLPLPPESQLNPHLRLLREMKDQAVEQKSGWLTACWANYRALYLAQSLGKEWIAQHLPAIQPKVLYFGDSSDRVEYAYTRTTAGAAV